MTNQLQNEPIKVPTKGFQSHKTYANRNSIYAITCIGIMTALTCILGPLSVPIGVVPISLTNFAIYLSVILLGRRMGLLSCIVYLCIGIVGLPVFSGFSGGIGKLLGPTGGYLIGYILVACISGIFIDRFKSTYMHLIGLLIGTAVLYVCGTIWLAYQIHTSFASAMSIGVLPFVPGDLLKIILALVLGMPLRKQLVKNNILPFR